MIAFSFFLKKNLLKMTWKYIFWKMEMGPYEKSIEIRNWGKNKSGPVHRRACSLAMSMGVCVLVHFYFRFKRFIFQIPNSISINYVLYIRCHSLIELKILWKLSSRDYKNWLSQNDILWLVKKGTISTIGLEVLVLLD